MRQLLSAIFLTFLLGGLCPAEDFMSASGIGKLQPMVALFGTTSFVPSLPLRAAQTCDSCLSASILGRGYRLHGRSEADQALQRKGVVTLSELTTRQAHELMEELNCMSLVQLTITEYHLQSARRQGARPSKKSPTTLQIAKLAGEIQIWGQKDREMKRWKFQSQLTDQDANLPCVPGECDRNTFGFIALQYVLEQAMEELQK